MPKGNVNATAPVTPLVAVTGSQPPYIYDLPLLLSLPDGFEFRFRYHQIWVSNDVLREMEGTPDYLLRRPLIVMFHSQEQKRLLPLRSCKVIGMEGGERQTQQYRQATSRPRDARSGRSATGWTLPEHGGGKRNGY